MNIAKFIILVAACMQPVVFAQAELHGVAAQIRWHLPLPVSDAMMLVGIDVAGSTVILLNSYDGALRISPRAQEVYAESLRGRLCASRLGRDLFASGAQTIISIVHSTRGGSVSGTVRKEDCE